MPCQKSCLCVCVCARLTAWLAWLPPWPCFALPLGTCPITHPVLRGSHRRAAQVIASYMEIYNDRLYDLLQPYKKTSTR